ncbi:MAG TPA: hypothetical protein VLE25_07695 [Nitrospira sp.]|nr:hypothetical protein [Nitrospira sp.]
MDTKTASNAEPCIEDAILSLCCDRPIQRFSDLAQALPQHSWRALFAALNRLAQQRRIELVSHPWDHEIIFTSASTAKGRPRVQTWASRDSPWSAAR